MSITEFAREPDPNGPQLRRFKDGRQVPYSNLGQVREAMFEDDKKIIDLVGLRMMEDFWLDPVADPRESARMRIVDLARVARGGHDRFYQLASDVYQVLAGETSPLIDEIDQDLVDALASRTYKAMLAAAFKWDRDEGIAPTQQALNKARAVEIAKNPNFAIHRSYGDFPDMVSSIYGIIVPKTANDLQQSMFDETIMDEWDLGLAAAFRDMALTPQA